MTAFLIDEAKRAEINAAVEQARARVIPWEKLRGIAIGDPTPSLAMKDRKGRAEDVPKSVGVHFEGGITAAISFEEQPAGIFRHLSVGTGKPGKDALPHPMVMAVICDLFGFLDFPPHIGRVWLEEYGPDHWAVNIIEMSIEREAGHA